MPFVLAQRTACRSFTFLVLLALTVIGLPALSGAQQTCQPDGDVDRNGNVTAADALLAFQQALSLVQLSACQLSIADVFPQPATPDGNITASDALCIFQKALGLPSCLDPLPSPNEPPMADAGSDQTVDAGTIVTLSGTADDTDGTIVSYGWEQTGGTMVSLSGADGATAIFTAPDVSTDETLTFRLTVTDDDGAQASDEVIVMVRAVNQPPDVSAGADQTVDEGAVVVLSGTASDPDGMIVSYQWEQTDGTEVLLAGAASDTATFVAPDVSADETLTFRLTVTDDDGAQVSDEVMVAVRRVNQPPIVNAGADQSVDAGTMVILSGSGADEEEVIDRYDWIQTSGTPVTLSGANSQEASFTAPDVDSDEDLVFQLTVTDNEGAQASDEVRVTVRPVVREIEQDALKVSVFGEGDIRVISAGEPLDCALITICQGFFDEGSEVVLEAAPDSDWTHERWVGCDEVASTRCTVFMDGDRFVSVTFLSTAPLELEDDVIVVQDDQLNGIIEYDADDGWLAFDANTVGVSQWAVGDILLSDGFDTDGSMAFARRIISIEDEPGRVTFHTIQASLDEIFRSGSISYHGQNHGDDRQRSDGPVVAQSADLTFEVGIIEGGVKASGTVDLPLDPEFAINFSPFEVRLIMHAEARGNIAIEISAMIDRMGQQELCIKGRCSIKLGTIPVGYGITVSPHLKVLATYEAEAAGRIRPSMNYGISASAGAHYKSGQGLKPVFKAGVDPGSGVVLSEYELELHAEIGLRAELQFKIEAGIFASAGPHVGFGPAFGVQSECDAAYANVYGGLRLTVGGELELLGHSLRYDIPAWQRKWAIKALYPPGKTPPDPTDTMVTDLLVMDETNTGLTLVWDPPQNDCAIAGYVIYRNDRSIARNITDTYFMDDNLIPGTEYCYQAAPLTTHGIQEAKSTPACVIYEPPHLDLATQCNHSVTDQPHYSDFYLDYFPESEWRLTTWTTTGEARGPVGTTIRPPIALPDEYGRESADCGDWTPVIVDHDAPVSDLRCRRAMEDPYDTEITYTGYFDVHLREDGSGPGAKSHRLLVYPDLEPQEDLSLINIHTEHIWPCSCSPPDSQRPCRKTLSYRLHLFSIGVYDWQFDL